MSVTTMVTVSVSIALAATGYIFTYRNNLRRDRLDRINSQLSLLYGPLFALARANREAWKAFRQDARPLNKGFTEDFWAEPLPTPEEAVAWRLWVTEVLMPVNLEMKNVIVNHADLLEGDEIQSSCSTYLPTSTPTGPFSADGKRAISALATAGCRFRLRIF
jgi:hypothetical protein